MPPEELPEELLDELQSLDELELVVVTVVLTMVVAGTEVVAWGNVVVGIGLGTGPGGYRWLVVVGYPARGRGGGPAQWSGATTSCSTSCTRCPTR